MALSITDCKQRDRTLVARLYVVLFKVVGYHCSC